MPETDIKTALLDAAKAHVPFDGWSEATFRAARSDTGTDPAVARELFPRGAVDMALAHHEAGDRAMLERLAAEDLSDLRLRERVAAAVRFRLEAVEDRELVRRGMALFALPPHAADGAQAIWRTADRIWTALEDSSDDVNWYTKRATLAGVCGATVLYWLGDDSPESVATWAFLDRRIADVMQFEKFKARARDNALIERVMTGPLAFLKNIRPPRSAPPADMPGHWTDPDRGDRE